MPFLQGLAGEVLGTAILLLVILSLLETRHVNAPSAWFFPLIVGATIGLLIMFIAPITQACFNPARDLGPRLMLLVMGFGSVAFPGPNSGLSLVATTIGPIIGGILGALFFDKVMRPNIPGHEVEHSQVTTLSQLAYDPTMEVRRETLHGHAAALPMELLAGADHIDLVMVAAGGCIYDDDQWALAVLKAARQLAGPGGGVDETEFWSVYDAQRQAQGGSLSRAVATRFLPSGDPEELYKLARSHFQVPASSMYPDARPTLAALATKYKLGVVANPSEQHIAALKRDGLMQYFDVVVYPEQVDLARTPSARMWKRALEETGVQADRAVHVGNRIDNDIRPAKQAGLHTDLAAARGGPALAHHRTAHGAGRDRDHLQRRPERPRGHLATEAVDLEAAGDPDDAGLISAGGEVAGLLGGAWAGPVGPVADEESRVEDLEQEGGQGQVKILRGESPP